MKHYSGFSLVQVSLIPIIRSPFMLLAKFLLLANLLFPIPASAQSVPANFASVCGTQICINGQPFRVHGATAYGHYSDPNIYSSAVAAHLNTLELSEFEKSYHHSFVIASNGSIQVNQDGTWDVVDNFIAQARENGLHVILMLSSWGQSLQDAGMDYTNVNNWMPLFDFLATHKNKINNIYYKDDPTILMIEVFGEIDANPNDTTFFHNALAQLRQRFPHHILSSGGIGHIDYNSGIDWRTIMSDTNNQICALEINSEGEQNITVQEVSNFCSQLPHPKPWFLGAWSSCIGGGGYNDRTNDSGMAAHAQDMYTIEAGRKTADMAANNAAAPAMPAIGSDFWNFGGTGGCDISLSQTPDTYAVIVNTATDAEPVTTPTPPPASGTTNSSMLMASQNNMCLDVTNWNFVNGNKMQIWTCNGGAAQKWSVKMSASAANGASSR